MQPLHICFFAPAAWPVLSSDAALESVGGAEVQQVLLARQFVRRGHRVSMICSDYGQPDQVRIDGIEVLKYDAGSSRVPLLKFFHPRLTNVWRALHRTNADVFYKRAASATNGVIALYAQWHRRSFIYSVACDLDLSPREIFKRLFKRNARWRNRQLFTLGLRLADVVVCQHQSQADACQRLLGRPASVVPSCVDPQQTNGGRPDGAVLWVGTLHPGKRPELLLELARRMPDVSFRMVGGPSSEDGGQLYWQIREQALTLPNVCFAGFVPYARVGAEFDAARVLVNTSDFEGFPNTFLEAWVRGVPSVSFCETGSAADGQRVAAVASDLDQMAGMVGRLVRDDGHWKREGARVRKHVSVAHSIDAAVTKYENIFSQLLQRSGRAVEAAATRANQKPRTSHGV